LQAVTLAAALNDVGSWALVSWQATFYQRVYELGPETYAPALAGILPVGGILGGVGGGLMGDWLSRKGGLYFLTSGLCSLCMNQRRAAVSCALQEADSGTWTAGINDKQELRRQCVHLQRGCEAKRGSA
jgi:hypothetical protein